MDSDRDDVLSLNDDRESSMEFSGFSPLMDTSPRRSKQGKSAVPKDKPRKKKSSKRSKNKENKSASSAAGPVRQKISSDKSPILDISKLSQQDISQLREVLGIIPQAEQPQYA